VVPGRSSSRTSSTRRSLRSGGRVATLRGAIENVVRRAEHGDRRIVAWSEHELTIVRSLRDEDPELVDRFEARFVNGKLVAQRWRNRCYGGDRPESGKLVDYLRLIDYPLPADAVGGDVGETIRAIRARLDRGLDPTPGQQARWGNLLEHNRHDCAGLRRVCLRATRDLEADGAAA
jgi:hypothetical protein